MGSGPFKFAAYEIGQSIKGVRNPDYYHKGQPYLDGFVGIFADKQAVRVDAIRADRAAMEFRGLPPSARDRAREGARRQDHGADERLELRQHGHAQPQEQAVRRRAGAPGAGSGDRQLARRAGARQDRHRAHGGRHRVSRARRSPRPRRSCSSSPASGRTSRSRAPRPGACSRRRGPRASSSSCSTATSTSPTSMSAPG